MYSELFSYNKQTVWFLKLRRGERRARFLDLFSPRKVTCCAKSPEVKKYGFAGHAGMAV